MTPFCRHLATALLGWAMLSATAVRADDLLPAERPLAEVIDHYLDARLKKAGVEPAPSADDATLVRRLSLDLIGRIPTAAEARAYVDAKDPAKRSELLRRLLASPEYVRQQATEFDAMLRGIDGAGPSLRDYLLLAFAENRPWDQMYRELLGVDKAAKDPERFVVQRLKDPDLLTRDVSSIFHGINVTCAQCHKHPYIAAMTQDYFFGMKAFFAGPKLSYKNKAGATREVGLMFLNGAKIAQPVADPPLALPSPKDKGPAIVTHRGQLVSLSLEPSNRALFARAIVNRLWFRFYGHGLVNRVDQMHAENQATHPELLQWLTRDLIEHRYDLRRLTEGLVSSKAYARSSVWRQDKTPQDLFAYANLRPLTPLQYGLSQLVASNPEALPINLTGEGLTKKRELLEAQAMKLYGALIEQPQLEPLQINVNEALRLSNDPALLAELGVPLARALAKLPDRKEQLDRLAWTVLSRPATGQEIEMLTKYLAAAPKELPAAPLTAKGASKQPTVPNLPPAERALHQVVWALLTSAEFRFNH